MMQLTRLASMIVSTVVMLSMWFARLSVEQVLYLSLRSFCRYEVTILFQLQGWMTLAIQYCQQARLLVSLSTCLCSLYHVQVELFGEGIARTGFRKENEFLSYSISELWGDTVRMTKV